MHISLKVSDKVGRKEVVTSVDSVSQRADVPNTIVETGTDSSDAPRGEGDGNDREYLGKLHVEVVGPKEGYFSCYFFLALYLCRWAVRE